MIDIKVLKESLVKYAGEDTPQIKRYVGYIDSINRMQFVKSAGKEVDLSFGISIEDFVKIYIKYAAVGIVVDGINAVVTGKNKVFITWVGYKNKVISVYPESEFDTQLVRKGDDIKFAKESGSVVYTHTIADPFSSNKDIIGAYCVIKNKRGEFLETLGKDDFENMKASAMMTSTWNKWESEFWLKSVIKRACKRHFNDVVEEIEKIDNEDYTVEDNYVKLTPLERTLSRYTGMRKRYFDMTGYDSENTQKAFMQNVIKKDLPETEAEAIDVNEALKAEMTEDQLIELGLN